MIVDGWQFSALDKTTLQALRSCKLQEPGLGCVFSALSQSDAAINLVTRCNQATRSRPAKGGNESCTGGDQQEAVD